jgi:hypothetical protein
MISFSLTVEYSMFCSKRNGSKVFIVVAYLFCEMLGFSCRKASLRVWYIKANFVQITSRILRQVRTALYLYLIKKHKKPQIGGFRGIVQFEPQ